MTSSDVVDIQGVIHVPQTFYFQTSKRETVIKAGDLSCLSVNPLGRHDHNCCSILFRKKRQRTVYVLHPDMRDDFQIDQFLRRQCKHKKIRVKVACCRYEDIHFWKPFCDQYGIALNAKVPDGSTVAFFNDRVEFLACENLPHSYSQCVGWVMTHCIVYDRVPSLKDGSQLYQWNSESNVHNVRLNQLTRIHHLEVIRTKFDKFIELHTDDPFTMSLFTRIQSYLDLLDNVDGKRTYVETCEEIHIRLSQQEGIGHCQVLANELGKQSLRIGKQILPLAGPVKESVQMSTRLLHGLCLTKGVRCIWGCIGMETSSTYLIDDINDDSVIHVLYQDKDKAVSFFEQKVSQLLDMLNNQNKRFQLHKVPIGTPEHLKAYTREGRIPRICIVIEHGEGYHSIAGERLLQFLLGDIHSQNNYACDMLFVLRCNQYSFQGLVRDFFPIFTVGFRNIVDEVSMDFISFFLYLFLIQYSDDVNEWSMFCSWVVQYWQPMSSFSPRSGCFYGALTLQHIMSSNRWTYRRVLQEVQKNMKRYRDNTVVSWIRDAQLSHDERSTPFMNFDGHLSRWLTKAEIISSVHKPCGLDDIYKQRRQWRQQLPQIHGPGRPITKSENTHESGPTLRSADYLNQGHIIDIGVGKMATSYDKAGGVPFGYKATGMTEQEFRQVLRLQYNSLKPLVRNPYVTVYDIVMGRSRVSGTIEWVVYCDSHQKTLRAVRQDPDLPHQIGEHCVQYFAYDLPSNPEFLAHRSSHCKTTNHWHNLQGMPGNSGEYVEMWNQSKACIDYHSLWKCYNVNAIALARDTSGYVLLVQVYDQSHTLFDDMDVFPDFLSNGVRIRYTEGRMEAFAQWGCPLLCLPTQDVSTLGCVIRVGNKEMILTAGHGVAQSGVSIENSHEDGQSIFVPQHGVQIFSHREPIFCDEAKGHLNSTVDLALIDVPSGMFDPNWKKIADPPPPQLCTKRGAASDTTFTHLESFFADGKLRIEKEWSLDSAAHRVYYDQYACHNMAYSKETKAPIPDYKYNSLFTMHGDSGALVVGNGGDTIGMVVAGVRRYKELVLITPWKAIQQCIGSHFKSEEVQYE